MKAFTLSFHFCSCSKLFYQKHGLQIKIKIGFLEKIQLLQCALWRQSIVNKKGPDIQVGQFWSLVFWFWSIGSKVMTEKLISRSNTRVKIKISFLVITFDPINQNPKTKNQYWPPWISGPILFCILCHQRAHCKSCIFSQKSNLNFDLEAVFLMEKFRAGTKKIAKSKSFHLSPIFWKSE